MKPLYLRIRSRRKLVLCIALAAVAAVVAIPLARSVGAIVRPRFATSAPTKGKQISLGGPQQQKEKLFPNLDLRVSEPNGLTNMLGTRIPGVLRRAQDHSNRSAKALSKLQATAPGLNAKASPLTGAVEVLRNTR